MELHKGLETAQPVWKTYSTAWPSSQLKRLFLGCIRISPALCEDLLDLLLCRRSAKNFIQLFKNNQMSLSLIQSFYFAGMGCPSYPTEVFFFSLNRHKSSHPNGVLAFVS